MHVVVLMCKYVRTCDFTTLVNPLPKRFTDVIEGMESMLCSDRLSKGAFLSPPTFCLPFCVRVCGVRV